MSSYDWYAAIVTKFICLTLHRSLGAVEQLLMLRDAFDARVAYQAACLLAPHLAHMETCHTLPPPDSYAGELAAFEPAARPYILDAMSIYLRDCLLHVASGTLLTVPSSDQ